MDSQTFSHVETVKVDDANPCPFCGHGYMGIEVFLFDNKEWLDML